MIPAIWRACELRPSPATMNFASIRPPDASRARAPEKFSSNWSIRSSISVMAGFSRAASRQFGDQRVVLDILAEGVEVDFARAEFLGRGREDRAGVVDHADPLHRGGMIGAARPQAERAVEAQRAFEQGHGAAREMSLDLADDHDLAALRREGVGGGKPRRAGAGDEHVAFDRMDVRRLFVRRALFPSVGRALFSSGGRVHGAILFLNQNPFKGRDPRTASGLWRQGELPRQQAVNACAPVFDHDRTN